MGRKGTPRELHGNFFSEFGRVRWVKKDLRGARELIGNSRELFGDLKW
jgi:hypothetical protein